MIQDAPIQHRVPTDGVEIAVLEWADAGVDVEADPAAPLLFVHATGFCAGTWRTVAEQFRSERRCLAYDQRGHGDSAKPDERDAYAWENYGYDCLAVLDALVPDVPVDAVGHSSGAATLVLAASLRPERFRRLVLVEPIIFPVEVERLAGDGLGANPLAEGARRRRMDFDSREEMLERFSSKPPMSVWDRRVLEDYVDWGSADLEDGGRRLKCPGYIEAWMYEFGPRHRGWDALTELECPALLVATEYASPMPVEVWRRVAQRIPDHQFAVLYGLTHFAPMEQPALIADLAAEFLAR